MNKEYRVNKNSKLLQYLITDIKLKRNVAKKLLANHLIEINGVIKTQFDYELKKNDILVILHEPIIINNSKKIDVLYEDNELVVINKPSGLLTIATDKIKENTAYHYVRNYIKSKNKNEKIFILHRLDKDTSGIVIFVKNIELKNALQENWNEIVKTRKYYALVNGKPKLAKANITNYLLITKDKTIIVDNKTKKSQKAITNYKIIKSNNKYSLLDIEIKTGKKNQIRATLEDQGYPILGDKKYGNIKSPIKRLCLHAYEISFVHPFNNKKYIFTTRTPDIFMSIIN